jgi:hypothetical protein
MYKRILVPLDGSARTRPVPDAAPRASFPNPSNASRLVDRLEAETQIYRNTITDGVQGEGIQTFSLIGENSAAEALRAVAHAINVHTFRVSIALPADNAG